MFKAKATVQKNWTVFYICSVWLKSIMFCNCLCLCSSSASLPNFMRNIGELGVKKCFTDQGIANAIQLFVSVKGIFLVYASYEQVSAKGNLHIIKIDINWWIKACLKWHDDTEQKQKAVTIRRKHGRENFKCNSTY